MAEHWWTRLWFKVEDRPTSRRLPEVGTPPMMPVFSKVNRLTIETPTGPKVLKVDTWKEDYPLGAPWLQFYTWYLDSHGSKAFVFKFKDSEVMVRRVDIISFKVDVIEIRTGWRQA